MAIQLDATNPPPSNRGVNLSNETLSATNVLSFGVDYLSCTTRTQKIYGPWYGYFGDLCQQQLADRGPAMRHRQTGYDGMLLAKDTFIGKRESFGDVLWVSSGDAASRDWQYIAPTSDNVTRIDLQVTCRIRTDPYPLLAHDVYVNRDLSRLDHTIIASKSGSTVYVGSHKSDVFGRIYDKSEAFDEQLGRIWRYEVQSRSKALNRQIVTHLNNGYISHQDYITSYVHTWFADRSCNPAFLRTHPPVSVVIETGIDLTYPDKQLRWLRTGVAPVISRLIRDGFSDRALEALGLVQENLPYWADVEPQIGEKDLTDR